MLNVRSCIAASALLLTVAAAEAQTPPPSNLPPRTTTPAYPEAVPGHYIDMPQSAQLKVNLGPAAGKRANPPPARPDAIPSPGFALALEAADAAVESCTADGYTVAVAVTDSAGKLKVALAPDGTRPNGVFMALRKDITAAAFGMSTLQLRQKTASDPSLMAQIKPNMSLLPGGLPIMAGGRVVRAISASGATAYEEEKCAQAGIQKIQSRLD